MILNTEPGKAGKISLYADGEYVLTVAPDVWYSLDYSNGCEVTDDELENIRFLINSRLAYAQALRFLTLRAHSADELYKKLTKKHTPECSEYAVEKCRELGFIDDSDFARSYAFELAERKKYGPSRIKSELMSKGIDRNIISNVVETLDIDFSLCIIDVINKKYMSCLDDEKGRRKMIAGLIRLGYNYSDIKKAMSELEITEDDNYEY